MLVLVRTTLAAAGAYLALGVVFAVAFQSVGLARVDAAARGAGWSFRVLITPGVIALWPVLLLRWRASARGGSFPSAAPPPGSAEGLCRLHAALVVALAVLAPLVVAAALALRPPPPPVDRAARAVAGERATPWAR